MASILPSWLRDYDQAEFDASLDSSSSPPSGRNSPQESHTMLGNWPGTPTRVSNTFPSLPPAGSSPPTPGSPPLNFPPSPPMPTYSNGQVPESPGAEFSAVTARISRTGSSRSMPFFPSPLNPAHQDGCSPALNGHSPFTRPSSRRSSQIARIASEESRALAGSDANRRSFMILYRRADLEDPLLPPAFPSTSKRPHSLSTESYMSLSSDSKYPVGLASEHGLVAYAYDPSLDEREPLDEEDKLHDPESKTAKVDGPMSFRGFKNFGMLAILTLALLGLFVAYPVFDFYHESGVNALIVGNTRINSTGQANDLSIRSQIPILESIERIDPYTPEDVRTRTTSRGDEYTLIFSDEFDTPERIFAKDADEFWTAVDDESHGSRQITTSDGNLAIHVGQVFSDDGRHATGLLRSRSPFCLAGGGYVDISVTLPHTGLPTRLFWSQHWSMTNGAGDVPNEEELTRKPLALTLSISIPLDVVESMPDSASAVLLVDYIRVYRKSSESVPSCDELSIPDITVSLPW